MPVLIINKNYMNLVCPECQNDVDLSAYPQVKEGVVVECNVCGITLMINNVTGDIVSAEVADEGK